MRLREGALAFFLLLAFAATGFAAGFQLFNEGSARVMGLGAAVTARTDMVESAWYNPSAAAFFKSPEVLVGSALVKPSISYKADSGAEYDMKKRVHPLPFFYAIYPVDERLSFSFSFNLPYGLTTDWDDDWPGRYDADYTSLKTFFFVPSVAIKINDKMSLSVGPQIVYADAEMERAILTPLGDVRMNMSGDDLSGGWLVSFTFKPWEHTTFAVIYRSEIELDLEGNVKYSNVPSLLASRFKNGDGAVYLTLPDTISFGVATTIFPKWTLSADILWSGWSAYDELKFTFEYAPGTGTPGEQIQPKNWHDKLALRLGAEYELAPKWRLRLGYVYDPSPIDYYTRGPELPTDDRQLFNIGLGYQKENLSINFTYTYLIMEDAPVPPAGSPGNEYGNLSGHYEGDTHIFGFDVSYRF
ncbi:OmpP1/FadL family transporter [Thermodesulfatator atlanticus]|uniref:OmpP1/FadL family transporter n=1 Tax=Thermodesulfatator atlanticus TaxID=501497 RepID=UPI0003B61C06|nr:outer membrane protein transport protein [Thermodesulfatator atlanticus]